MLLRGGKPGTIAIEAQHEVLRIALDERKVLVRERSTGKRDGIREPGLVRVDDVHLPLHEERELALAYRVLRAVHREKDLRLLVEVCFGTVKVLRFVFRVERATGERDRTSGGVLYREHE